MELMILPIVIHKSKTEPIIETIVKTFSGSFFFVIFSYEKSMIFQPSNGGTTRKFNIAVAKFNEIK